MKNMIEKIEQIKSILNGTFADEADREYWKAKLAELERKVENAKKNVVYFENNAVYDR